MVTGRIFFKQAHNTYVLYTNMTFWFYVERNYAIVMNSKIIKVAYNFNILQFTLLFHVGRA